MKKIIKILSVTVFILMASAMFSSLNAQPNPGYDGNGGAVGGPPIGGGAPLGSGIVMMAVLAVGYGARKVYDARKKLS
jgi:hypothetical protein